MKIINTDVVIIGAGPTGLSLAYQLIRYGVDFIVVEKNEGHLTRRSIRRAESASYLPGIGRMLGEPSNFARVKRTFRAADQLPNARRYTTFPSTIVSSGSILLISSTGHER